MSNVELVNSGRSYIVFEDPVYMGQIMRERRSYQLFSGDSDYEHYFTSPSIEENERLVICYEVCFGANLAEIFFSSQQQHLMNTAILSRELS